MKDRINLSLMEAGFFIFSYKGRRKSMEEKKKKRNR